MNFENWPEIKGFKPIGEINKGKFGKILILENSHSKERYVLKKNKNESVDLMRYREYAQTPNELTVFESIPLEKQRSCPNLMPTRFISIQENENEDVFYTLMPYYSESLEDRIKNLNKSVDKKKVFIEKKDLCHQISKALSQLQGELGRIHYDLKSENVYYDGEVIVGDFGTSFYKDSEKNNSNILFGDPRYRSPKHWRNDKGPHNDLYQASLLMLSVYGISSPFEDEINQIWENEDLDFFSKEKLIGRFFSEENEKNLKREFNRIKEELYRKKGIPKYIKKAIIKGLNEEFKDGVEFNSYLYRKDKQEKNLKYFKKTLLAGAIFLGGYNYNNIISKYHEWDYSRTMDSFYSISYDSKLIDFERIEDSETKCIPKFNPIFSLNSTIIQSQKSRQNLFLKILNPQKKESIKFRNLSLPMGILYDIANYAKKTNSCYIAQLITEDIPLNTTEKIEYYFNEKALLKKIEESYYRHQKLPFPVDFLILDHYLDYFMKINNNYKSN